LLFFELTAFFSEFHLSRLARTKALKKNAGACRYGKLSTARPGWLGSCGEVVI